MTREPYSQEAEQGVLGAMLIKPELIDILAADLKPDDFFFAYNRAVFKAILQLQAENRAVDFLTVAEAIGEMPNGDSPLAYCAELHHNTPSAANAKAYAAIVLERATDRALVEAAEVIRELAESDANTEDKIARAHAEIMAINSTSSASETISAGDAVAAHIVELERREQLGGKIDGLETGIEALDQRLLGLKGGQLIVIAGRPAMGKAQPLTANVLLADGTYIGMGDIRVGDQLASVDGQPSAVVGVYPQGIRQIYAVTLADGRVIEADAEHLWSVRNAKWQRDKTMTTLELVTALKVQRNHNRITLVPHAGLFGGVAEIGVSPWLLGFLLGDGYLNGAGIRFSASEAYILERVKAESGMEPKHVAGYDYGLTTERGKENPLLSALRELGVMGSVASTKSIPSCVMSSSYGVRAAVLCGLLESDGWVQAGNCVMFSSSSIRLRDQVVDLVRSLGGSAKKTTKTGRGYRKDGELRACQDSHQAAIRLKALNELIRSPRLRKNLARAKRTDQSPIVSVEYVRDDLAQCIRVSHPSALYITDGYAVTHNTTLAMNIADHNAVRCGHPVLVYSLEMTNAQLIDKSLASLGSIPLNALRDGSAVNRYSQALSLTATRLKESGLTLYDRRSAPINRIRSSARRHKLRHGLKLLVVDHVGLVDVDDAKASPVQRVSEVTRQLKLLAMELDVPVIMLSQLNRLLEQRPNKRPVPSDLRDSGSVEQDADTIIFVYRDEVYHDDTPDRGIAEIILGKVRDGETGTVRCRYQGKYSLFSDLNGYTPPPPARLSGLLDD